ncbi:MAG: hypothetical protein GF347_00445 [Candidatus Moranbacteria bacterium]|nr:hypothetical protein [Candidatus Moranbacteria bacterium]
MKTLTKFWFESLLAGVLIVIIALLLLVVPNFTLRILGFFIAAFFLVEGVFSLIVGVKSKLWSLIFIGGLNITASFIIFFWSTVSLIMLVYLISAWMILNGLLKIISAGILKSQNKEVNLLTFKGIILTAIGLIILFYPDVGLAGLVLLVSLAVLTYGLFFIFLSFKLRSLKMWLG